MDSSDTGFERGTPVLLGALLVAFFLPWTPEPDEPHTGFELIFDPPGSTAYGWLRLVALLTVVALIIGAVVVSQAEPRAWSQLVAAGVTAVVLPVLLVHAQSMHADEYWNETVRDHGTLGHGGDFAILLLIFLTVVWAVRARNVRAAAEEQRLRETIEMARRRRKLT